MPALTHKHNRSASDHPVLDAWLDKHDARFLWRQQGNKNAPIIEGWRIKARVVLVLLFPIKDGKPGGWDLVAELDTSDISQTFAAIETELGLAS